MTNVVTRLFELRTYVIRAAKFGEFLQATNSLLSLRTRHSPLFGYWSSEIGGLNEVVHLWHYESLAERTRVRCDLAEDDLWTRDYIKAHLHASVTSQTNTLLKPLPNTKITHPNSKGVAELVEIQLGTCKNRWNPVVERLSSRYRLLEPGSTQLAGFYSVCGAINRVVLLVEHQSQDHMISSHQRMCDVYDELYVLGSKISTKLLVPQVTSVWTRP